MFYKFLHERTLLLLFSEITFVLSVIVKSKWQSVKTVIKKPKFGDKWKERFSLATLLIETAPRGLVLCCIDLGLGLCFLRLIEREKENISFQLA